MKNFLMFKHTIRLYNIMILLVVPLVITLVGVGLEFVGF